MSHVEIIFENNHSKVTVPLEKFLELLNIELTADEIEMAIRKIVSAQ